MQSIKAAVAVFCTACICAELVTQVSDNGWTRHGIKVIAGLYILAVAVQAFPQAKAEWNMSLEPSVSSVALIIWNQAVLEQTEADLARQLEQHVREEFGVELSIAITLREHAGDISAKAVTITPAEYDSAEKRASIDLYIQSQLGVLPEWKEPGREKAS